MAAFDDPPRPARADALEQALSATLAPDETLLWSGFPAQGILFRAYDWVLIPLSLFWGGFAIAWEAAVFVGEPDVPDRFDAWDVGFALWGVPFVLVGLYIIVGRFLADAMRRARTIYAVTDQRAILLTSFPGQTVRSVALRGTGEIALSKKADGRGTIAFGAADWMRWPANGFAFERIARAEGVLKIVRDAQSRR